MKAQFFIVAVLGCLMTSFLTSTSFRVAISQERMGDNWSSENHQARVERFEFKHLDKKEHGLVYMPSHFPLNQQATVILLIDFAEQHFTLATDEFEKIIEATAAIQDGPTLVVTLDHIPDIDATPQNYMDRIERYKSLAKHIDTNYYCKPEMTLIGKGSEAGIVLTALFLENPESTPFSKFIATDPSPLYTNSLIQIIDSTNFSVRRPTRKLHFSFSTSNDRESCLKLIRQLKEKNYPWLQFRAKEYRESNFETTYPVAFTEGIDYLFNTLD